MICRASVPHLRALGLRYFNRFALWQLREDYKRDAWRSYTAEMLSVCARFAGAEITETYSDIISAVEKPSGTHHETTLDEAQACWEKTLEDSRRAAEGGEDH